MLSSMRQAQSKTAGKSPQSKRKLDLRMLLTLLGLLLLISILWNTIVVYPLRMLVVFFHELSHGTMALITGGRILRIELVAIEGGLCITQGGIPFLVLSAGYLGSLLWGGALLVIAARSRWDRYLCMALGGVMLLVALLWVRPVVSFGFLFTLLIGAGLIAAGWKLNEDICDFILKLIGLVSILYVPMDILSDTLARPNQPSDARMLGIITGIPGVVWGTLWTLLALAAGVYFVTMAARNPAPHLDKQPVGRRRHL